MIETIRPKCFYWMLLDIRLNIGNIVGILAVHKVDFRVRHIGEVSFFSNFLGRKTNFGYGDYPGAKFEENRPF